MSACREENCSFLHELLLFEDNSFSTPPFDEKAKREAPLDASAFPALPSKPKPQTIVSQENRTNGSRSQKKKQQALELGFFFAPRNPSLTSSVVSAPSTVPQRSQGRGSVPTSTFLAAKDWTSSGEVVANTYKALREEAKSLAVARNALLEQATAAYIGYNNH